jgi:hypothetical protein
MNYEIDVQKVTNSILLSAKKFDNVRTCVRNAFSYLITILYSSAVI